MRGQGTGRRRGTMKSHAFRRAFATQQLMASAKEKGGRRLSLPPMLFTYQGAARCSIRVCRRVSCSAVSASAGLCRERSVW